MRILDLKVHNFRGFDNIRVTPRGHVLLVGEPRAGRSDLLAALALPFRTDGPRTLTEFDFFEGNRDEPIGIEVTLGEIEDDIQQLFLEQLDFWDYETQDLIGPLDDPAQLPESAGPALRLGFEAEWNSGEEQADQTRYWVKGSNVATGSFRRVSRADRSRLPLLVLSGGRPLNLAPMGGLRSLRRRTR